MTDAELILASQRDPARFRELYDRLADDVLAYPYRRVLDAEVAADLLAETFAVAFERRGRFADRRIPLHGALDDDDGRWTRYRQGCAILAGGQPDGAGAVIADVFVKR